MNDHGQPSWPEPPAAGPLGNGRYALAHLRPDSVSELCQAISAHVREGHAIYPQGGATALDYGGIPGRPGVAVDTRSLGQVIDYPHADMTITVQAGITAAALHAVLADKKQRLLIDIPQPERATLGGVFATSACGPRRYGSGRPRDQIIGVSFVTSEGVEVKGGGRVVKNVAGYDFPKLLTGSLGTLGVITQMTLKVRPRPEASAVAWVPFAAPAPLAEALDALNVSGARPVALDLLDAYAAGQIGGPMGLPAERWVLAIGLEDNATSVRWQIDRLRSELGRPDLNVPQDVEAAALWDNLTDFTVAEPGPLSCVLTTRPSAVVAFIEILDPLRWTVQAHAGNGVVRLHALGAWEMQQAAAEIDRFRSMVSTQGGSVVVTRCPADWNERLAVWGPSRPDWEVARRVQQALDPAGAMNPGRFVGAC